DQNQILADGTLITSDSAGSSDGTTQVFKYDVQRPEKDGPPVFTVKRDLEIDKGRLGLACAARAMKFVVYGANKKAHSGREPWVIYIVDVLSRKKQLVVKTVLKSGDNEMHEPFTSVAVSPEGRQLAYVSGDDGLRVILKTLP